MAVVSPVRRPNPSKRVLQANETDTYRPAAASDRLINTGNTRWKSIKP